MDGVYVVYEKGTDRPLWIFQDAVSATLRAAQQRGANGGEMSRYMRTEFVPFGTELGEYLRLR